MPGTTANKVEDPCQECRDRHLKCDDSRPKCLQCIRLGEKCRRGGGRLKFRYGSSARYDATFDKDQTWLQQSKNAKIQFVDQGPELENYYAQDEEAEDELTRVSSHPESSRREGSSTTVRHTEPPPSTTISPRLQYHSPPILSPTSATENLSLRSPLKRQRLEDHRPGSAGRSVDQWTSVAYDPIRFAYRVYESPKTASPYNWDGVTFANETTNVPKVVEAEYQRLADSAAAAIPPEFLLTPAIWKQEFYWPNAYTTTQCACLMRYYIEHLAPWFDVGDPARNFALVVPQRARRCPPLLNAIFTAAARHLASLPYYRNSEGIIQYQGITLPKLNAETAIQYHNACIAYLIRLSEDTVHVQDENLLAAAVILRYYEELDTSFTGNDTEIFLHTFQIFVAAQVNTTYIPAMSPGTSDLWRPGSANGGNDVRNNNAMTYLKSFQHACFRIALRQETMMAFMKQRSIRLPLETWSVLAGFDEAEDFAWADRHLYHCAQVLQFCFGAGTTTTTNHPPQYPKPPRSQIERWNELKTFENQWEENKPLSFSPIHYEESHPTQGHVLPQIWYMSEVHVSGMQYLDLARILLTVYNPSIPRLGPGATAAHRRVSSEVRALVLRLCGIAVSNASATRGQPALVQAFMAIAICGEHFADRTEQRALLEILAELEREHGWPTSKTADALKGEWGWA